MCVNSRASCAIAFNLWLAFAGAAAAAPDAAFERAQKKLELIDSGAARPGSVILLTPVEINAWCRTMIPQLIEGVSNPRVDLATGAATGSATIDFLKIRQGEGLETNALIAKLIDGERPVKVSVRIESGGGRATVYLTGVEISGVPASGYLLDFLVKTIFVPMFPEAHINEPFDLDDRIERLDFRPDGVRVHIKR